MHKVFTRSLVAAVLCASAVSTCLAETAAGGPPRGGAGNADLFEPFNQKECDYPSPCGCGCNPKTAPPPGSGAVPVAPSPKN